MKKSLLIIISLIFVLLLGCSKSAGNTEKEKLGTYTIMVYMVGSDLESEYQAASVDILEMLNSNVNLDNVNILLCTGGSKQWWIGLPNNETYITQIVEVDGETTLASVGSFDEAVNMGESDTLAQFLKFGYENYDTDHYALICWNHGGGPIRGYGNDELYGYDSLVFDELKTAMDNSPFDSKNKLDWIGFDACLMASVEIANLFSDYAEYMIASEEVEPGCGWDYSFLSTLNETSNTEKIAKSIIDSYEAFILENQEALQYPDITLSCMDLSKIDIVTEAMDKLFEMMAEELDDGDYQKLAKIRSNTKTFQKGSGLDLVDLGHASKMVSDMYSKQSKELTKALEKFVIYQATNVASTYGVSVYYPYESQEEYTRFELLETDLSASEGYTSYFENYADIWLNGVPTSEWETNLLELANASEIEAVEDKNQLVLQLSDKQLQEMSAAYYTILCDYGDGDYNPVLMNCEIEPDKDGLLKVDLEQELIVAVSGESTDEQFLMFKEVEQREDGILYQSVSTTVSGPFGVFDYTTQEPVVVNLFESNDGDIYINSINYVSETAAPDGKQTVNLEHWDTLSCIYSGYHPLYDENNNLLPYNQWRKDDGIYAREVMLDDLHFEKKNIADFNNSFVCQITVMDVYGNVYASNLEQMYDDEYPQVYTENTSVGTFSWELYKDYAKLASYQGTSAELDIPDTVKNLPVAIIGSYAFNGNSIETINVPASVATIESYAFANCTYLQSVKLSKNIQAIPEGAFEYCTALIDVELPNAVKYIGRFAFRECTSLKHIEIPKNVKKILPGVFYGCDYLQKLTVNKQNSNFVAVDGVLFSSDMKQLISCPSLFRNSYTIPKGVEEICDFAFGKCYMEKISGNQVVGYGLTSIVFPESLKKIGDGAFMECTRLKNIKLPEKLEIIGSLAFGDYSLFNYGSSIQVGKTKLNSIEIGDNVSWIGDKAFAAYDINEFVVSESNIYFSAHGNKLTNKNGTVEISVFYE